MAVEYVLYDVNELDKIEKINKIKEKIISNFDKSIDGVSLKENNAELSEKLLILKQKVASDINKELVVSAKSIPICTVTNTKIYTEMTLTELEKCMSESPHVIYGDDGSKIKTFAAFKKIIEKH